MNMDEGRADWKSLKTGSPLVKNGMEKSDEIEDSKLGGWSGGFNRIFLEWTCQITMN